MTIRELIENKSILDYQQICTSLIQTFRVAEKVNWESVLPAQQQQEYFGGETLRLVAEHPILSKQKDIRPIALKKGSISQMLFFYVCLQDSSLPKKQIQDVTKKFISGGDANRYIIWFFGNKDGTALKVVLSGKEGRKVVLKTLPFGVSQPYYKTYDFIIREVNQKVNQLFVEPTDLWKALWAAFDISVINRNFYEEIKGAFNELITQLNKNRNPFTSDEDRVQFAIRLIGRIIFCWFLKRKEVLHDAALSSEAVKAHQQKNYYHDLLEPLFFDVLNTPDKERKGGLPKTIAHYPFLNGGLFDAQETDYKQHMLLTIDNDWFHQLFSKTLERYNFTVDENSSSNAEIAIDPEMLGRIFENLLAEQNPETGESARKATGSFYTPREIVDYMVEQSVGEFLKTSLALDEKVNAQIEDFVHTQVLPDALSKHEEQISSALNKIKILDPACGSGAFPIGILQKVVSLKQQLHPKTKNYKLKLDTIQNSIYGVDIQPMAVELSRLRCWLSLVVDEDPKDIKALPNLDFKFVCADGLMPVGKMNHQLDLSKSAERIAELKELRSEFFNSNGKRKKELEKEFKNIQTSLNKNFLEWDGKSKLVENLASWKPFGNQKTEWFDAFWMFGIQDGFDVVIANPPYIQLSKVPTTKESYKEQLREIYGTSAGRLNTFIFFIHRGVKLLRKSGVLAFIIPNTILTQDYYKFTREQVLKNFNLKKIVNYIDMPFENAVVENVTLIISNEQADNYPIEIFKDDLESISLVATKSKINFLSQNNFSFNVNSNEIIESIFSRDIPPLSKYCEVNQAIALKGDKSLSLKNNNPKNKYYKLLDGRNINKYSIKWDGVYLDYDLDRIHSCKRKDIFESSEKLMFRRVSENLIFSYDNEQYYALNTIVVINLHSTESINLKYILSILNSKLLNYLYKGRFKSTKKVFSEIQARSVEQLPIIESKNQIPFISIAEFIIYLNKFETAIHQSVSNSTIARGLEDIIDGMVLELYFPEETKGKKVNIIDLVEKELGKIGSKDTPESIYSFYKSVSHPDSEINNRILSFALVSPDVLKPILQG